MGSSLHDDAWSGRLYAAPAAGADRWVWDSRGPGRLGRFYRPQGPYPREEAARLAADLNSFLRRNALPGDPPLEAGGPFHVSSSRERLERGP